MVTVPPYSNYFAALQPWLNRPNIKHVLIPLLFVYSYWCAIATNTSSKEVIYSDPMESDHAKETKERIGTYLKHLDDTPSYRIRRFNAGTGPQIDNYSCGVFVLLSRIVG